MENSKKTALSLLEVLHISIGLNVKRKIQLLITTIGLALIVFFCVFSITKHNRYYESNFEYGIASLKEGKYIDNTVFNYKKLASKENLNKIKTSNSEFNDIDVDSLYNDDGIEIFLDSNYSSDSYGQYSIKIKCKYFSSKNQAAKFIDALAKIPYDNIWIQLNQISNDTALQHYKNYSVSYLERVNDLQSQINYLSQSYEGLISSFGDKTVSIILENNLEQVTNISAQLTSLDFFANSIDFSSLKSQIELNNYVLDYESEVSLLIAKKSKLENQSNIYALQIEALNQQIDREIESVVSSGITSSPSLDGLNSTLAYIIIQKAENDYQIEYLKNCIDNFNESESSKFSSFLDTYYDKLIDYTNIYNLIQNQVYSDNMDITYKTNSIVSVSTGMKLINCCVISVISGLVISMVINLSLDLNKYKKSKEEVNN